MRLPVARLRYDIVPIPEGWRVNCNDVHGPPYSAQTDAILDTLAIAETLIKNGDVVEVRLLELDGAKRVWRKIEPRDARLYR